jgi:TRAP-type C4-dicarboxylate transport system substrate-binding protein
MVFGESKGNKGQFKKNILSKLGILVLIGVIIALVALSACVPQTTTPTTTAPKPAASTTAAPTTAAPTTAAPTAPATSSAPASATAPVQTYNWKAEFVWNPGDSSRDNGWVPTLKQINQKTNGQLNYTFYEPDSIIPTAGMLRAVSQGTLDMALTAGGYYSETPEKIGGLLLGLPMAWTTPQDVYSIYYEHGLLELLQKVYADSFNVKFFPNSGSGAYGLSTNFEVTSLASFKGKVIRTTDAYAPLIQGLGAQTVNIAGADLYTALRLGTINGMGYSFNGFVTQSFGEVIKYAIRPALLCPSVSAYFINMDSWNKLPKSVQDTFAQTVKENFLSSAVYATSLDDKAIKDSGVKTVQLSDADKATLYQLSMVTWDKTATNGPISAAAIKILKDYYKLK